MSIPIPWDPWTQLYRVMLQILVSVPIPGKNVIFKKGTVPVSIIGLCGIQLQLYRTKQWTIAPNIAGFPLCEFCEHRLRSLVKCGLHFHRHRHTTNHSLPYEDIRSHRRWIQIILFVICAKLHIDLNPRAVVSRTYCNKLDSHTTNYVDTIVIGGKFRLVVLLRAANYVNIDRNWR